jgi:SAM-dependent methyltransferase
MTSLLPSGADVSTPGEAAAAAVLLKCHLYKDTPSARIENELRELHGEGIDSTLPLDAEQLNAIDSMHYEGQTGTLRMMKLFPARASSTAADDATLPVEVLDLGSGFGGCARFVAARCTAPAGARVTALELQPDISATARALTQRCGLAHKVRHLTGDACTPQGLSATLGAAHGSFEVVFSKLVVLHVPFFSRPQLWANLAAAAPGALLYLEDYFEIHDAGSGDATAGGANSESTGLSGGAANETAKGAIGAASSGGLTCAEVDALDSKVGCSRPPTQAAWTRQLTEAGCTDVSFEDCTAAWAAFVAGRSAGYRASQERHARVHGAAVCSSMQEFYDATSALLGGGRLGGCVVTARLPSNRAPASSAKHV